MPTSYIQGQLRETKEVVESARAGLLPQKGDVRKKRKEKDQGRWSVATRRGREIKKRKRPRKARRWLPRKQGSVCPQPRIPFFLVHEYLGSERPILIEVSAPALFLYEEAMCEGSFVNGLLYAAKAVP